MREYEPKHPLEVLDTFLYPNLLKDSDNKVFSENITWFTLANTHDLNKILEEIESKVKKSCQNAEIAYCDSSGNRWIFLILNGNKSENKLRRMQTIYKKLYRRMNAHWNEI
jgi:hypothetical protein